MTDGNLRSLLHKHLPQFHWQSLESWSTGQGVPDVNYCYHSADGWIELKKTDGWTVNVSPHQVAWIERRLRAGGRVFILVRRKGDELWLLPGSSARDLLTRATTLRDVDPLDMWVGGPARWDWSALASLLVK
jgi:hypothetical protein